MAVMGWSLDLMNLVVFSKHQLFCDSTRKGMATQITREMEEEMAMHNASTPSTAPHSTVP